MLLHLHAGWDTLPNTGWNDTNITAGVINDTPQTGAATVTMTLRSWATGKALQTWKPSGKIPAYSSHNFTVVHRAKLLGSHAASSVFLTADVALSDMTADGEHGEAVAHQPARAHHFFTKMKVAELHDPEIKLAFGGSGGNLTVTISCRAPAPHVFLDPGMLIGHWSDNGMLLLPGEPRTLVFDAMGEDVTVATLKKNVVARSPWSTRHPAL